MPLERQNGAVRYRSLSFPVSAWRIIDAVIDNSMSMDSVDGEVTTLMSGAVVRDAGWRASFHQRGDGSSEGPRGGDAEITVELSIAHWEFVMQELDRWHRVDDSLGRLLADLRDDLADRS
jgi:hypothetical protein